MRRSVPFALILFVVLGIVSSPSFAQSCGDLEQRIVDLTRRIETLEGRLASSATAKAPAVAPANTNDARDEALALYKKVDGLVARGNLEQANREVSTWDQKHAGTPAAGWTRALNRELAVVGKAAPTDWSIDHWYQGESDVALDGKSPTLVVFWEAWCPHCKDEVPKMQALWEQYKPKGLQVVGVTRITQTATEESVRAFLTEKGIRYPMAKETGDLATYFDVKGIPAAALVKDGKIVWRGHPMRLTDELLTSLF